MEPRCIIREWIDKKVGVWHASCQFSHEGEVIINRPGAEETPFTVESFGEAEKVAAAQEAFRESLHDLLCYECRDKPRKV